MRKIKAISINGKPLTMCKLGGGILMDKRKPTAYYFDGSAGTYASFTPFVLDEVGSSVEVEVTITDNVAWLRNWILSGSRPRWGTCLIFNAKPDKSGHILNELDHPGYHKRLKLEVTAPNGVNRWYAFEAENLETGEIVRSTFTIGPASCFNIAITNPSNTFYTQCTVHGIRINGGEWMSIDQLPGIQFYGNVTKVK